MKITVISSTVFPVGAGGLQGYGGLEQVAWLSAKGLAAKGHDVTLVAPDGSECPGAIVIHTGPAQRHDEKMAYGGFGEHKEAEVVTRAAHPGYWQALLDQDVVIDHSWQAWSYMLKAEGRLKCPVLKVFHAPVDTMYKVWPPQYPGLPPVERPCPVCISRDQASHFEALFGTPARVCHNGIDLDFYKPTGSPRSGRFLFLARFSQIKGPHLAIEACQKAGVGLDLVGDTSITNEPDYLARCQSMCDGKQVKMVGPASRGECVWWFSQAHCLLHPNKTFREPFGLAPVEAMACGCPVIGWDFGAMRETVKHGETGWLVRSEKDLWATVRRTADHPEVLWGVKTARGDCREWASQFSIDVMTDRYEELCKEALDTGGW